MNLYFVVCWSLAAQGIKQHQFSDFPVIGFHDQISQAHEVRPNQADCEKITTKDVPAVMENVPRCARYSWGGGAMIKRCFIRLLNNALAFIFYVFHILKIFLHFHFYHIRLFSVPT